MADAVRVEGLAEVRKGLRKLERSGEAREVTKALKQGATLVATAARPFSARSSGKLAAGWRAGSSGNKAFVRNRVPYAGVHEFGGTIKPKGTEIKIKATPSATRALEDKEDRIVALVSDALDELARRYGWR
jgi:phage gpG-like protein